MGLTPSAGSSHSLDQTGTLYSNLMVKNWRSKTNAEVCIVCVCCSMLTTQYSQQILYSDGNSKIDRVN